MPIETVVPLLKSIIYLIIQFKWVELGLKRWLEVCHTTTIAGYLHFEKAIL